MVIDTLYGSIFYDQLSSSLLADFWNSRYIVRGISHQTFQLNELPWCYTVFINNILLIVIFNLCFTCFGLWYPDLDLCSRDLKQVSVSRYK